MASEVIFNEQDTSYVPDFDSVPDFCGDSAWYQLSGDDASAANTAVEGEPGLEAREKTSRVLRAEVPFS